MDLAPSDPRPPYDEAAHDTLRQLVRNERGEQAARLLEARAPRTREQRVMYELACAALCDLHEELSRGRAHCLRALRLAGRGHALRQEARRYLVLFLIRLGDLGRAERQTLRALADVHNTGDERQLAPKLLRQLGLIHRQRGRLSEAIHCYERALSVGADPPGSYLWATVRDNIAMTLVHQGEAGRALELMAATDAELRVDGSSSWPLMRQVIRARIALESGDLAELDRRLALARATTETPAQRLNLCLDMYSAESLVLHDRSAEAVVLLETVFKELQRSAPHGDMVAEVARRLASALFTQGRYDEALTYCEVGIRTGRRADYLEWAASLRVAGQCLVALGELPRARGRLSEALSLHEVTELVLERRRLEQVLVNLKWPQLGRRLAEGSGPWGGPPATRSPLPDGRFLLTNDADLLDAIRRAAATRLPVLIEGETGTGKDLVARLIHESGSDPSRPFAIVDCASVPAELAEVELFGSIRGAYTGAVRDRRGMVESADGGTLFLDELPTLPLELQAKLLRVIQDGSFRRVGEDQVRRANFRIIAATNRDVAWLVSSGKLKEDLFYRLNGHRLRLRPLREQSFLVPELAKAFAQDCGLAGIDDEVASALSGWTWRGNVRELELVIRVSASSLPKGSTLGVAALPETMRHPRLEATRRDPLRSSRLDAERETLRRLLERHGGNVAAASRELGRSRQAIYKALRRAGLEPRNMR